MTKNLQMFSCIEWRKKFAHVLYKSRHLEGCIFRSRDIPKRTSSDVICQLIFYRRYIPFILSCMISAVCGSYVSLPPHFELKNTVPLGIFDNYWAELSALGDLDSERRVACRPVRRSITEKSSCKNIHCLN